MPTSVAERARGQTAARRGRVAVPRTAPFLAVALLPGLLFLPEPATAQSEPPKVAILLYDGVQVIDHAIPYEVFGQYSLNEVYTVAADSGEVRTFMGMRLLPHYSFADAPTPDVLVLPGGDMSEASDDPAISEWVRDTAARAEHVLTVCTGVFFLVGTDLLKGSPVTTWYDRQEDLRRAAPEATVISDRIVVDAGKLVTAAGTGIEGALTVLEKLHGPGWREVVRLNMEHQALPESVHVPRVELGDLNLPGGIYGVFPWREAELARYEGGEDGWTSVWVLPENVPMDSLSARLEERIREDDGWSLVTTETRPGRWTSRWRLQGRDGLPWSGGVRLIEADGRQRLEIEVHRGEDLPPGDR